MSNVKRLQFGNSLIGLCVGLVLIGAALALWLNRQYVVDWLAFTQYSPTAAVRGIADRTTMNDTGTFYFFGAQPQIEAATTFNKTCARRESSTAILGCYTNSRIFVYDVTDKRLDGIKEVTAAHEMLHATYQRLSESERQRVNDWLEKEYQQLKTDKDLTSRMAYYDKNEPGEKYNELHSIIGTEYGTISAELETYYARYFNDRRAVVQLHNGYATVFSHLEAQATALSTQLKTLGAAIEQDSASYNDAVKVLNKDIETFNGRASSGDFKSQAAFDRERSALMNRANALDMQRQKINTDMTTYESLRTEYNQTAATSNELYKSMDSNLAPAPSVQ